MRPVLLALALVLALVPAVRADPVTGGAVESAIYGTPLGPTYNDTKESLPCVDGHSVQKCVPPNVFGDSKCIASIAAQHLGCEDADPVVRDLVCLVKDPLHHWCE